jgi:hypothetical protein
VLLGPAGDLQVRAGPGRLLHGTDTARPAIHADAHLGQVGCGSVEVVGIVDADVQLDQPPDRRGHDA